MILTRLGQYIMDVKQNTSPKEGGWVDTKPTHSHLLPLILSFESETRDTALVVGISPLTRALGSYDGVGIDLKKAIRFQDNTMFKSLFQEASKFALSPIRFVSFDNNAVELSRKDLEVFIGSLDLWMKKRNEAMWMKKRNENFGR